MGEIWANSTTKTKIVAIIGLLITLWMMTLVVGTAGRMIQASDQGESYGQFTDKEVFSDPCFRSAVGDDNPLLQPIGSCEFTLDEYKSSGAYSYITRHSVAGSNYVIRLLITALHVFGALSCLMFIAIFFTGGGSVGSSKAAEFSSRVLLRTVYTMAITGMTLYFLKSPEDLNFFPRPQYPGESPVLRYAYLGMFGLSFINAVCHMSLGKMIPRQLLVFQTWASLLCGLIVLPWLLAILVTQSWATYQWQYALEMIALVSIYPLIDLTNLRVLNRYSANGATFEMDGHRHSNAEVFLLYLVTTLLFFLGSDHYYFFEGEQIPLVYRLCLDFTPFVIWAASGRAFKFFNRSYRLSAA